MASRRDSQERNRFRIKPAAPKSRGGPRAQRFISQGLKEVSKAGAKRLGKNAGRPTNTFGRGRIAASMAGQKLSANARRVIIKCRFVVLRRASPNSIAEGPAARDRAAHGSEPARRGPHVGKGLADELNDSGYLVVDGVDGRAHNLRLTAGADLGNLPMGAIVESRAPVQEKVVDRIILSVSREGIYSTAGHRA